MHSLGRPVLVKLSIRPEGRPIWWLSPQALDEAERTLSPPIQRVPLQEALQARPVERSDTPRVSPETLASHNRWQNRAFATFTIVALACLTVVAVAALITIGRRR